MFQGRFSLKNIVRTWLQSAKIHSQICLNGMKNNVYTITYRDPIKTLSQNTLSEDRVYLFFVRGNSTLELY
jgi:hypothetical protein